MIFIAVKDEELQKFLQAGPTVTSRGHKNFTVVGVKIFVTLHL